MTSFRKVVVTDFGDVDVLKVVDDVLPPPPPGHVQIAVEYASLGGADINMRMGSFPLQKKPPFTPGYALAGVVRASGPGCKAFQVGDAVVVMTKYDADATLTNQPERYCVRVPDGVDRRAAAALACDWLTAWAMVKRSAKVARGQRVFVHGVSGAVGSAIMILSRLRGADVYGTASERNHEAVRRHGGTPFVYSDKKWMERMKELGGAHAVFDALGFESFDESYAILAPDGVLVAYGNNKGVLDDGKPKSPVLPILKLVSRNFNPLTSKKTTFYAVSRDASTYKADVAELLEMAKNGDFTVPIKNIWNLEDIQTAHREWGSGSGIGALLIKASSDDAVSKMFDEYTCEQESRLDLNQVLGNESGHLEVGASNFARSAVGIDLKGTALYARLQAKDGSEHDDTINLDAIVENRNGELVFLERREGIKRNITIPLRPRQPEFTSTSPHLDSPPCNGCQDWPDPRHQDVHVFRKQLQEGKANCASCGLLLKVINHYKPSQKRIQKASCAAEKPSSEWDLHRLHLEYYVEGGPVVKKVCVLHRRSVKGNPPGIFAEIRAKYLSGNFSSPGSVDQARMWLETCIEKHGKCESFKRRLLPARVLDLGTTPKDSVELLCNTGKWVDSYACLSHCWGKPKKGQPEAIKLTTRNESSLRRGVAVGDLPKNYRDAIYFCKLLRIRYLWIDALCIIQDSSKDWACESLKMASYYGNCTVCLAATRSPDHDGGFQPVNTRMEYQLPGVTGPASRLFVTEKLPEVPHFWSATNYPHEEHYPLLTRAWVYQERRLSPRLLHFCGNELVFECKQHTACECDSVAVDSYKDRDSWTKAYETYYATHHDVTKVDNMTKIQHEWHSWVRAYSRLNLTYVSDRLPAISGVAHQVKERREVNGMPTGRYLAGLWEETLLDDMSWCVGLDRVRVRRDEETHSGASYRGTNARYIRGAMKIKHDEYVAPSWSWASVLSPVEFAPFGYKTYLCQLLDVQAQTVGPNEFSRVTAGHVLLQGQLLETRWDEIDGKMCLKDVLGTRLSLPLIGDRGMVWFPDYNIRSEGKHKLSKNEKLYILPLVSRPILGRDDDVDIKMRFYLGRTKVEAVYLVLKRVQSAAATPTYERVGWAEYTGSDWEKVPDMRKARETKVLIV
ncbi:hypothetical protein Hte_010174 [Hypoxylon texense]